MQPSATCVLCVPAAARVLAVVRKLVEFYSSEEEQRKLVNLTNKTSITPLRLAVERERTQVCLHSTTYI
jgi:hypothetical protein